MNNIEKAKKIVSETKTALIKYVISEERSVNNRNKLVKFIKESSPYNILHFVGKGSFPKDKTTPIKSLLESAIINRVINKLNPQKTEIQHFTESCKSVLLSNYSANKKVVNFIMNESTQYEICHLAMVGKLPTNYSYEAKRYLIESIGNKIANKYGKTSFITEGFIHELIGGRIVDDFMRHRTSKTPGTVKASDQDDDSWVDNTEYVDSSVHNNDSLVDNTKYVDTSDNSNFFDNDINKFRDIVHNKPDGISMPKYDEDIKDVQANNIWSRSTIDSYNKIHDDDNIGRLSKYKVPSRDTIESNINAELARTPKGPPIVGHREPYDVMKDHAVEGGYWEDKSIIGKLQNLIVQGKATGSDAMKQLQKTIGDHPDATNAVGAVAAASLAIYGANKLYRKYMANASKATQGKPAGQAANILKNAKTKANQAKMADLQKSLAGCKATKNPAKCQKLIQDKIKAARAKK
jgi:hypothetical protein